MENNPVNKKTDIVSVENQSGRQTEPDDRVEQTVPDDAVNNTTAGNTAVAQNPVLNGQTPVPDKVSGKEAIRDTTVPLETVVETPIKLAQKKILQNAAEKHVNVFILISGGIFHLVKMMVNPKLLFNTIKTIIMKMPLLIQETFLTLTYFLLIVMIITQRIVIFLSTVPLIGIVIKKMQPIWQKLFAPFYSAVIKKLESVRKFKIKRSYLVTLALKNLSVRKSRSLITIFGMSVGIGIIVYLLSLGYGIERLVISQVAGLDELKIIDVSAGGNTALKLSRDSLARISKITSVEKVIPSISIVGRLNFQKAKTDMVVYAVPGDYLKTSKINIIKGKGFTDNSYAYDGNNGLGRVAGAQTKIPNGEYKQTVSENNIYFNIIPDKTASVWTQCSTDSEIIGYTVHLEGGFVGKEYWGSEYYPFDDTGSQAYDSKNGIRLGKWIKAKIPIYTKLADDSLIPELDDLGRPKWLEAYIQEKYIQINDRLKFGTGYKTVPGDADQSILGEATASAQFTSGDPSGASSSAEVVSVSSSGIEFVQLQSTDTATLSQNKNQELKFKSKTSGQAVISSGLMSLLGLNLTNVLGTKFQSSFIIVKSLMPEISSKTLSSEVEYSVIGVVEDPEQQYFYVPLSDLSKLGISAYSQIKVVLDNKDQLINVRKKIDTLGYNTASAVDTVSSIESLFGTLRLVLGLLGFIALAVASLGMFNTLTVSLLERTREIAGMKTIGMVSGEVQDLFLAEAMILGFSGGIGGISIGFLAGKLTSGLISMVAITQGLGYMDLTYIPLNFIIFIITSSFIVGIVTGIYPAQRAKKISALNALRYE